MTDEQATLLADRTLEAALADRPWWLGRLASAGLAGALIWGLALSEQLEQTQLMLVTACVCLGALSASQELRRERVMMWRERQRGVSLGALLKAKLRVLTLLGFVQVSLLSAVAYTLPGLRVPLGWLVLTTLCALLMGVGMGLRASASARTARGAWLMSALASLALCGPPHLTNIPPEQAEAARLGLVFPTRWGARALSGFASGPEASADAALALLPLLCGAGLLLILTRRAMSRDQAPFVPD